MAQLAFGVAAAGLAGATGYGSYAGLAFTAGTLVYSLLNPPEDIVNEGPRVNRQISSTSAFGLMRPIVYGTMPVPGNIIDSSAKREIRKEQKQDSGGKGGLFGGGQDVVNVYFVAEIDLAIGLGEGEIDAVLQVYANNVLILDLRQGKRNVSPSWLTYRVYYGTEDQQPDPTLESIHGVGNTPAYRGEAYIVFPKFQLEQFGNQVPNFRVIVASVASSVGSKKNIDVGFGLDTVKFNFCKYKSFAYYITDYAATTAEYIGIVYDAYTQDEIFKLKYPPDSITSRDIAQNNLSNGCHLIGLPTISAGVTIPAVPNQHVYTIEKIFAQSDDIVLFYDAATGDYLGRVDLPNAGIDMGAVIPYNETDGYVVGNDGTGGLVENIKTWKLWINPLAVGVNKVIAEYIGICPPPIPDRQGANEWNWRPDPTYPFGTTRQGKVAWAGVDTVDANKEYFCILDDRAPLVFDCFIDVTSYFWTTGVTKIIWDNVQSLFWVIGQGSSGVDYDRFLALDDQCNVVHSVEIQGYSVSSYIITNGCFSSDLNKILWRDNNAGVIRGFSTTDFSVTTYGGTGYTEGSQPYNECDYHHGTRTFWSTSLSRDINIYDLEKLSEDGSTLESVVNDMCRRAGLTSAQYDATELSTKNVRGYGVFTDGNIRNKIVPLQQTYLFDGIDQGDKIVFKFRGQSSQGTIIKDELGTSTTSSSKQFIKITRAMDLELPGKTEITYYGQEIEYEQNTQLARRRASFVTENKTNITLPIVLTDDEGIRLADTLEHLAHIEREIYEIEVLPKWQWLCAGDVVEINVDNQTYKARILTKSFENGILKLRLSKEESSVLTSFLDGGVPVARTVEVPYNPLTYSLLLDCPLFFESQDNAGYPVAACGMADTWTGGNVYRSTDGTAWELLLSIVSPTTIGSVVEILPDKWSTVWDNSSVITVEMKYGTLESKTREQVLQGQNYALIGADGRWEVVGFSDVTLISTGVYELKTLIRGRLGTEWATGTHETQDNFVLLDPDAMSYVLDSTSNINVLYLFRSVSFGQNLYGDQVLDKYFTNTGVCLKPFAPAQLEVEKDPSTLDLTYTWQPRTRYRIKDFWSTTPSNPENYDIVIRKKSDQSVLQTGNALTTNTFTYTRAQQLTDGLSATEDEALEALAYQNTEVAVIDRGYPYTLDHVAGPLPHPLVEYSLTIGAQAMWLCGESSGTDFKDYFGNYDGLYENGTVLNQASLLTGGTPSIRQVGDDRAETAILPVGEVNYLSHSVMILFTPEVASPASNTTIWRWTLHDINQRYFQCYWQSDNTIRLLGNTTGFSAFDYSTTATVSTGNVYMIIFTFHADDWEPTQGTINFYFNNSLIASQAGDQRESGTQDRDRFLLGYRNGLSINSIQHRKSHLVLFDHGLTRKEVNNLWIASGL